MDCMERESYKNRANSIFTALKTHLIRDTNNESQIEVDLLPPKANTGLVITL